MQEMPDLKGQGTRIKYPRMQLIGQYKHRDIVEDIVQSSSFTRGDIEGVIVALSEAIAYRMAKGYSVKIEGLGCFKAKLGLREGVERESEGGHKRNATSIEVAGINYKADTDLLLRCNQHCHLERGNNRKYTEPQIGRNLRLENLRNYLVSHRFIHIATYALLTGLSRSSAAKELRAFREEGLISTRGVGTHLVYTLNEE